MLTVSPWSVLLLQWTKLLSRHSTVLLVVVVAAPSQTSSLPRQVEMEEAGRSGRKGAVDWSQEEEEEPPWGREDTLDFLN